MIKDDEEDMENEDEDLINVIDSILATNDKNKDGFIDVQCHR